MKLAQIRQQIDTIDANLVDLLNQRAQLAQQVRQFKPQVLDKAREQQVIENALAKTSSLLDKNFVKKLFTDIMAECRRIQGESQPPHPTN